jgi:hypothetical protein
MSLSFKDVACIAINPWNLLVHVRSFLQLLIISIELELELLDSRLVCCRVERYEGRRGKYICDGWESIVRQKCQNRGLNTGPPDNIVVFSLLLSQLSYSGCTDIGLLVLSILSQK